MDVLSLEDTKHSTQIENITHTGAESKTNAESNSNDILLLTVLALNVPDTLSLETSNNVSPDTTITIANVDTTAIHGGDRKLEQSHQQTTIDVQNIAEIVHGGVPRSAAGHGDLIHDQSSTISTILTLGTSTPVTECGFHTNGVCISKNVINKIANELTVAPDLVAIKQTLKCEGESCVLKKMEQVIGKNAVEEETKKLKPHGPKNSKEWLSNIEIEEVLEQFGKRWKDFAPIPFAMIDFMETGHYLSKDHIDDLYKKGKRCWGTIINTDVSTGQGQHWMALFCDLRGDNEWTAEFFNSTGDVFRQTVNFLNKESKDMAAFASAKKINVDCKSVVVCDIEHQKKHSECGVYGLFYIYSRLSGVPYEVFKQQPISDEKMYVFRKVLFREH